MDWNASNSNSGLIQIPVILLSTVGVMALSAWRRHPGWWLMTTGVLILLLGYIAQTFFLQATAGSTLADVLTVFVRAHNWGFVIFALGFATLGGPVANAQRRLQELDPSSAPGKKSASNSGKGGGRKS